MVMIEGRTMPPLNNQRHERFAQALFEGETADAAYEIAGFKANRGNASRLKANESIMARLAELQTQTAKSAEVTVESLLAELEHARSRADGLDQLSAAVKAISEKAKISGLLVQKIEVGGVDAFSEAESYSDLADRLLDEIEARFHPVTDDDREALTDFLEQQADALGEFLASINARPVSGHVENPAEVRWREFKAKRDEFDRQREFPRLSHNRR
jgi:phage terminase small subunit